MKFSLSIRTTVAWIMKTIVGERVLPRVDHSRGQHALLFRQPAVGVVVEIIVCTPMCTTTLRRRSAQQFNLNADIIRESEYVFSACLTRVFRSSFWLDQISLACRVSAQIFLSHFSAPMKNERCAKNEQSLSRCHEGVFIYHCAKNIPSSVCFWCDAFSILCFETRWFSVGGFCVCVCYYKGPKDFCWILSAQIKEIGSDILARFGGNLALFRQQTTCVWHLLFSKLAAILNNDVFWNIRKFSLKRKRNMWEWGFNDVGLVVRPK
jgi:hypothetical protein